MPCRATRTRLDPVMNAADSTLQAAITRARWSIGAQLWTAANDGTMNRPPAADRPNSAKPMCRPHGEAMNWPTVVLASADAAGTEATAQPRSRQNTPISRAAIGTRARFGRSLLACAAIAEPTAMPRVKISSEMVSSFSSPPIWVLASACSSDKATAPTSQNHDDMRPPIHSRRSRFRSASSVIVEVHGLRSTVSPGARAPVAGISCAEPQQAIAKAMTASAIVSA